MIPYRLFSEEIDLSKLDFNLNISIPNHGNDKQVDLQTLETLLRKQFPLIEWSFDHSLGVIVSAVLGFKFFFMLLPSALSIPIGFIRGALTMRYGSYSEIIPSMPSKAK
jgi:hypothetical protein